MCYPPSGCVNGVCIAPNHCSCASNWDGTRCDIGKFNITKVFIFNRNFTLIHVEECSLPCVHGDCVSGQCLCDYGWSGLICDQRELKTNKHHKI